MDSQRYTEAFRSLHQLVSDTQVCASLSVCVCVCACMMGRYSLARLSCLDIATLADHERPCFTFMPHCQRNVRSRMLTALTCSSHAPSEFPQRASPTLPLTFPNVQPSMLPLTFPNVQTFHAPSDFPRRAPPTRAHSAEIRTRPFSPSSKYGPESWPSPRTPSCGASLNWRYDFGEGHRF